MEITLEELIRQENPTASRVKAMGVEKPYGHCTLFYAKTSKMPAWFVIPDEEAKDLDKKVDSISILKYLEEYVAD